MEYRNDKAGYAIATLEEREIPRFKALIDPLDAIIKEYDEYWSHGVSPDLVLEEMMDLSLTMRQQAAKMKKELERKIQEWENKS